jgi:hypothetical protein
MSKFESTSYDHPVTILKHNEFVATPVLVDKTGVVVNDDGKYIVKAGTVVGGNTKPAIENPTEPVVKKNDPAVAASAELVIDDTLGAEVSIILAAVEPGAAGNSLKVQLLDPSATSQALSVSVSGDTIVVSLATDGTGAITSTVAEVVAAINSHLIAKQLVNATVSGEDSTVAIAVAATALTGGDDGSGYEAEGVLLYDVDVTHGDAPGAMIVWGFIDKSKLDEDPCDDAVEALKGRIVFFDV